MGMMTVENLLKMAIVFVCFALASRRGDVKQAGGVTEVVILPRYVSSSNLIHVDGSDVVLHYTRKHHWHLGW